MSINHNRIKVADLEKNQPNKILTTNIAGELEFSDVSDILVNDLTTGGTTKALTAEMGKSLQNTKVDKVTGKSLVSDTEITRLGTLSNYTHPANHPPSIITQDTSNRFVTDAEKATWNAKQPSGTYATGTGSATGVNTGDNAVNSLYSGLESNATHTGDATGSTALTVKGINGTLLSGLATGLLKNTTGTGIPSIAMASDFPILNQNTTGTAATITGSIAESQVTNLVNDLGSKVDKVAGKSLVSDTEITRLGTLSNYTHPANHPPSIITQDASNRFVTDAEKAAWNAKQSSLGFTAENVANKNVASGYAGLGPDGKLISSQLPALTINNTFVIASQAAMLALTVETGDIAVRTDLNKSFILKGVNPTLLADWQELLTPTSAVATVFGRTGVITANTGDYLTSQVLDVPNKRYQTDSQAIYNDATSSIQTQLNNKQPIGNYEPSFTKLSAFNKNFGTIAGTITEGNDSRILNGQTAFGWGNHAGLYRPIYTSDVPYKSITNLNTLFTGYNRSSVNTCQVHSGSTFCPDTTAVWGMLTSSKSDDALENGIQTYVSMGTIPNTYVRNCYNGIWDTWRKFLTDGNYNSYAPTLTGVGASGTWGINVTGNAGSVAWSGITSKPSTIAGYGITDSLFTTNGNIQAVDTAVKEGSSFYAANASNAPTVGGSYGSIFTVTGGISWYNQLGFSTNGTVSFRQSINSTTAWSAWQQFITSTNIGSQSVNYATTANSAKFLDTSLEQWQWTTSAHQNPEMSIKLYDQYSNFGGAGNPTAYGTILNISGRSGHLDSQLYFGEAGQLLYRSCFYGTDTWSGFKTILTDSNIGSQSVNYATTAGSAPANGGTSSAVTINYNNDSNSTYQMLWGSGNSVFGTAGIYCNPYTDAVYATAFYASSDIRFKKIIKHQHKDISELKAISYKWKDKTRGNITQLGYSAQDVQKYIPNAVSEDKEGFLSVNYTQVLVAKVESLEQIINKQKQLMDKLEQRIKKLENGK